MGTGELAAFGTALCWTVTVMSFETDGKKVGSLSVNIIRLFLGLVFLSVYCLLTRGSLFPAETGGFRWLWLGLSGVVGFFLGVSLSLVAVSLTKVGIASTIMALVPVLIILPDVFLLGKRVRPLEVAGAFVAVAGVALVSL